jgi:hypothetical protein
MEMDTQQMRMCCVLWLICDSISSVIKNVLIFLHSKESQLFWFCFRKFQGNSVERSCILTRFCRKVMSWYCMCLRLPPDLESVINWSCMQKTVGHSAAGVGGGGGVQANISSVWKSRTLQNITQSFRPG